MRRANPRTARKKRHTGIVPAAPPAVPAATRFEIVDRICERLADGMSLRTIREENDWCPSNRTFDRWLDEDPELRAMVEQAKTLRAEAMVENMMVEVGTPSESFLKLGDKRLQVEVAKWMIGARLPAYNKGAETLSLTAGPLQISFRYETPKPIERDDDSEMNLEDGYGPEAAAPPGPAEGNP